MVVIAGRTWPLVWRNCNWMGRVWLVADAISWYAWRKYRGRNE